MSIAPRWPDFSLEKQPWGRHGRLWVAKTYTGRPKTPIFAMALPSIGLDLTEDSAREIARMHLDARFKQAHPNGCPGRAEGGVLETQPPEATERVSNPSPRLEGSPSENV